MNEAKYVMNQSGQFVIGNSNLGLVHPNMSKIFLDGSRETSAGFVYIDADTNQFVVYGRSTGLDMACDPFAADAMNDAFQKGNLMIAPMDDDGDRWIAGNFEHDHGRVIDDLSALARKKII